MQNNIIVESDYEGLRLDVFLQQKFPDYTRSYIKNLIDLGNVFLNQKTVKAGEKIKTGQTVSILIPQPVSMEAKPQNIDIDIVYQDDDLLVINKQKGMVVHPANGNLEGTLVNALLYHIDNLSGINGVIRPGIVHRLDKNTSGLLLVAKNDKAHVNLSKQIEEKSCHRFYLALCSGNFKEDKGIIKTGYGRSVSDRKKMSVQPLGLGKYAETEYNVIERFGRYTLVEFKLNTGRTHQIRVHCKHIGHSIIGDDTYGIVDKAFKTQGQLLHAYKIQFKHPSTNKDMEFTCPLSDDFLSALNKLNYKLSI